MHLQRWKRNRDLTTMKRAPNGSGSITAQGYKAFTGANNQRFLEHVKVAEKALGRKLPKGSQVHHLNGNGLDNRPENLVICPTAGYHRLLHDRERALDACGHPDWRRCGYCRQWDDPKNLMGKIGNGARHRHCHADAERLRKNRYRLSEVPGP